MNRGVEDELEEQKNLDALLHFSENLRTINRERNQLSYRAECTSSLMDDSNALLIKSLFEGKSKPKNRGNSSSSSIASDGVKDLSNPADKSLEGLLRCVIPEDDPLELPDWVGTFKSRNMEKELVDSSNAALKAAHEALQETEKMNTFTSSEYLAWRELVPSDKKVRSEPHLDETGGSRHLQKRFRAIQAALLGSDQAVATTDVNENDGSGNSSSDEDAPSETILADTVSSQPETEVIRKVCQKYYNRANISEAVSRAMPNDGFTKSWLQKKRSEAVLNRDAASAANQQVSSFPVLDAATWPQPLDCNSLDVSLHFWTELNEAQASRSQQQSQGTPLDLSRSQLASVITPSGILGPAPLGASMNAAASVIAAISLPRMPQNHRLQLPSNVGDKRKG